MGKSINGKTGLLLVIICLFMSQLAYAGDSVVCAGCKTEYYLIVKLTDVLNAQQADYSYKPAKTGNKKAVELMVDGKIDFAFTCKDHWKLVKKFGLDKVKTSGWCTVSVAHDPIVVVTNPDCGLSNLTKQQLCDIFSGSVSNWKAVGGADKEIKVGYLDDSVESGVVTVFKETSVGADAKLTSNATLLKAPSNLGNFCNVTSGAIVFMGMNSYKQEYGRVMAIDGVSSEVANVVDGKYPLAVTYHIIYDKNKASAAEKLLDFMAGEEGTKLTNEMMVAIEQKEVKPK